MTAIGKGATFLNDILNRPILDLRQEWINKPYETNAEKKDRDLSEEGYQKAAQELGIDFRSHTALKLIDSQTLRIKRESGEYDEVHPEDIGVIWSGHKVFSRTNEFDNVLVNPYAIEKLLNTKLYVHRLLEDSELSQHIPKAVPYGMGLIHDLPLEISSVDKVVYKPNSTGGGRGVRIFSPQYLKRIINPKRVKKGNERIREFFDRYCDQKPGWMADIFINNQLNAMELYSYLIQEFIPSKPIRSSETELGHDSCIRAIVFDGEFIDAYHRLSPIPLSEPETSSTKYIDNLHYGALAEPLSDDDKTIVADFAERIVGTLEDKIENNNIKTTQDFKQFREQFWRDELERVA